MNNKKVKLIYVLISMVGIIFPVGFLLGLINEKVAFPIIFLWIGCLQLFHGLILQTKYKTMKIVSIVFGILFIVFAVAIVIPSYYFK